MVTKEIDIYAQPTEAQIKMLEEAAGRTVVFDEDCPEFTADELKKFRMISDERQSSSVKQTVTIRLSPAALRNAKSLGKGYTSVLGRILEDTLSDSAALEKYL